MKCLPAEYSSKAQLHKIINFAWKQKTEIENTLEQQTNAKYMAQTILDDKKP